MNEKTRLRGSAKQRSSLYPLGEIPREVAIEICRWIVHRLAVGYTDLDGDGFAGIFAKAIGGKYKKSPLGLADVVWNGCAWSAKTVQNKNPFSATALRLISGRNSPSFSQGITDPLKDVDATGRAVLSIWNKRVNQVLGKHDDLRVVILVRNISARKFVLFEDETVRYIAGNYQWEVNKRGNLEGFEKGTGVKKFTWQPHGSQFTIHRTIPTAASKFKIAPHVSVVEAEHILRLVKFHPDWIEFQS